ncbi:hypothetical protein OIE67_43120 [Nonomuraea fuscirosea]|uniref:hypothetical protein n=1 Tax=Nonomuraea fuscirosea TaxID=1291556 RepID=UPI002DD8886D|nr:hypothetical protein [Nonomuraea fuscirosea]WSA50791.1 hypothetical protein OIE67_43120 [Nonomuraea fuscirosea]
MEFQGWSEGLALRPRDYLGKGDSLAAVVRAAGPYQGESLYLLALGTATTMARLHLGGIAGLRLRPGNVVIGAGGQASFAPGPRDAEFPAQDVKDWADVIVFAGTGHVAGGGVEPDLDRLLPALRAVIDECRRPDPFARPTAVDLVRILLGHSGGARGATVHELLLEAERRTRPYEPEPPADDPAPAPLWRRPAYLAGLAVGVLAVAVAAGTVVLVSSRVTPPSSAARPAVNDVTAAIGRRTATFEQRTELSRYGETVVADGRLSFDANAATAYDMKLTCGNAPRTTRVSLVGRSGVAAGVPFDAVRPPLEPCDQSRAPSVRDLSSPHSIQALIDAAESDVTSTPEAGGRTITGSALAHRVRGEEGLAAYAGTSAEGPIEFTLRVDAKGLPVSLKLHLESRADGTRDVETVYRDWRAFEAIEGETPNG